MNENEIKDFEYAALKLKAGVTEPVVSELITKGYIESHRDMVPDNIQSIVRENDVSKLTAKTRNAVANSLDKADLCKAEAECYISRASSAGIRVFSVMDREYPFTWRQLSGMPRVFFAKGNISFLRDSFTCGSASVVGSRSPGRYSRYAARDFSQKLAGHGVIIVSGLALGIDGIAHEAALDAGGKTIAITPGGPDVIYPFQHDKLYERLYSNGLVISEMPPGQNIIKQYFPARNRLISGLSDCCLIMEAGRYSGTLHTASYAGIQGKDVFVLPNSIYAENSIGGLMLIRDGAEVLIDADTVLDRIKETVIQRVGEYGETNSYLLSGMEQSSFLKADPLQKMKNDIGSMTKEDWMEAIRLLVEEKPRNFDELSGIIPMEVGKLMALITEMELSHQLETERGKYVLTIQKV